jgi:RNA polymerase sigma-70 factor (ECF subfamily)
MSEVARAGESPERNAMLVELFGAQRGRLWALAYRLTGSADDAEDVVQEAFSRLVAEPPDVPESHLGRWLARVATNLAIDALRERRRTAYVGPWLPSPVETDGVDWLETHSDGSPDPESRYSLGESVTYAFLLALEALGPRQRAVLLLRDVLGYSAEETGDLIGASAGNVRVLHLRARRSLDDYDKSRCIPTPELREQHRLALQRFLECLVAQDARGLEAILAESVRTVTDAAGEYTALALPLAGRARVARFYLAAAVQRLSGGVNFEIRLVNGLPAALITLERPVRRQAPRSLLRCELDGDGRIRLVHAILAPRKLIALGL